MVADWYKARGRPPLGGASGVLGARYGSGGPELATVLGLGGTHAGGTADCYQAVLEVSYARIALGSLALRLGRLPEAIESFKESAAVKRRAMLGESPEQLVGMRAELASTLSWLGKAISMEGSWREAIDAWRQSLRELANVGNEGT